MLFYISRRYYLNYENTEDFCIGLLILFFPFRNEMSEIHTNYVKELMLENWQVIQEKIKQIEAFKVMTDLIKDIQKMMEKEEEKH